MKKITILASSVLIFSALSAKSPIKTTTKTTNTIKTTVTKITTAATKTVVTESDNASGLKNALSLAIEQAVAKLSAENGFLRDSIAKINIPSEASPITKNIKFIPGGKDLVDKAEVALNRTAEDAVKEATPIFKNAITSMTITDATTIIFGKENAATDFLRQKIYAELQAAFLPKVKASLGKPLVAGVSTSDTWNTLSAGYNATANSTAGKLAKLKPVSVELDKYVTEQALNALFLKMAEQEKNFRKDPKARTTDILKKVFGQLDKK